MISSHYNVCPRYFFWEWKLLKVGPIFDACIVIKDTRVVCFAVKKSFSHVIIPLVAVEDPYLPSAAVSCCRSSCI
jgi:tRNA G37 N-methylase Trm5